MRIGAASGWAVGLAMVVSTAAAQEFGPRPQQPQQPPNARGEGTIKAIQGPLLLVEGGGGEKWSIRPNDLRQSTYNGTASPAWLHAGLWVRFTGQFDQRGASHGAVDEVEVFTYRPSRQPREGEQPGLYPAGGVGALDKLFGDEKDKPAKEVKAFKVVGQVTGVSKNRIQVATPGAVVSAELAENARVAVSLADPTLARVGDKVTFDGWASPQQPNQVLGNRLTFTGSEPLGVAKPAKPSPKKPAKPAEAEGK